jgi:hypothetical protein
MIRYIYSIATGTLADSWDTATDEEAALKAGYGTEDVIILSRELTDEEGKKRRNEIRRAFAKANQG